MAIEIKTIACPQCGSTDVQMTSEAKGVCCCCGAQFTVRQGADTQNVYNEVHVYADGNSAEKRDSCRKMEISPEYSKDQFIRKAWITLAAENAPIEVFNETFRAAVKTDRQILIDSLSADVKYQASVGYDREEPYTDYETYYEQEPYIAYEKQWNNVTKQTEERQVTKYKRVQKQRPVTKYKTVTDWSATSGSHHTYSVAVIDMKQKYLNEELFLGSFCDVKGSSLHPVGKELAEKMQITDAVRKHAAEKHKATINSSVCHALPGDHNRDLSWKVSKITDHSTNIYKTPEYVTSICFNGKTYFKYAFPFGPMNIGGNQIENNDSPTAVARKKLSELKKKNSDRRDSVEKNVIKVTNGVSVLTIGLLAVSILVSLCIRSIVLSTVFFAVAAAAFFYNTSKVKKETKAEMNRANKEIEKNKARTEAEIDDFTKNYKIKLYKALNNKLTSLGYEPAAATEL